METLYRRLPCGCVFKAGAWIHYYLGGVTVHKTCDTCTPQEVVANEVTLQQELEEGNETGCWSPRGTGAPLKPPV